MLKALSAGVGRTGLPAGNSNANLTINSLPYAEELHVNSFGHKVLRPRAN
jgi:hypothetical protein